VGRRGKKKKKKEKREGYNTTVTSFQPVSHREGEKKGGALV